MATVKQIRADVSALLDDAVNISNLGSEVSKQSKKAAELKSLLGEGWQGKSGDAVATMLDIWYKQEKEIAENLIITGKTVCDYANTIDITDKGLAKLFQGLFK